MYQNNYNWFGDMGCILITLTIAAFFLIGDYLMIVFTEKTKWWSIDNSLVVWRLRKMLRDNKPLKRTQNALPDNNLASNI